MKGKRRKVIQLLCPEEFKISLDIFIDTIEKDLLEIENLLESGEPQDIEEAKELIIEFANDLY